MKVSREQAARHREKIVKTASRLFRERGFDGIGVADLMAAAGFTHGGLYGHFSSKEDLMAEACSHAFAQVESLWQKELDDSPDEPLETITSRYLTDHHRRTSGTGCPLASWAVDASRQPKSIRQAFTAGLRRLVNLLADQLGLKSSEERYQKSLATWSTLVGAIVLARAVNDPQLSKDILISAADCIEGASSRK